MTEGQVCLWSPLCILLLDLNCLWPLTCLKLKTDWILSLFLNVHGFNLWFILVPSKKRKKKKHVDWQGRCQLTMCIAWLMFMGMVFLNVYGSSRNGKSNILTKGKLVTGESLRFYLQYTCYIQSAKGKSVNTVIIFYQVGYEVSYVENILNISYNLCSDLEAEH